MLTSQEVSAVVSEYQTKPNDTGSPEVQVALLTRNIVKLSDHFKTNHKDNHSRRGLISMVNKRRSLLDYLKRKDNERYRNLIQRLGLRR